MRHSTLSALILAPLLGACVSVLPEPSTPDALYRVEAQQKFEGLSHHLIIREPEAPRLIAGAGMVSEGADGGLRLIPGVEWSGSATRQIQLAMIDSFEVGQRGNAMLPEMGVLAGYELASQLKTLGLNGTTASCVMTVSVITTSNRDLLALAEVTAAEQSDSNSGRDRAAALRNVASRCAAQAAQFAVGVLPAAD